MTAPPRRQTPDQAREAALDAARGLLVAQGPQAVTLKAVAALVGRSHANLLHHFGSADGLHTALITRMAGGIVATIRDAVLRVRDGQQDVRAVVDLVFDAFDSGGAGALAGWMILSGNHDALAPIMAAIHDLVVELGEDQTAGRPPIAEETLHLVLMALGDALLGAPMANALRLPRGKARDLARAALAPRAPVAFDAATR